MQTTILKPTSAARSSLALAFVFAAAGCADDETCEPLDGIYRVTYTEESGNCGDWDGLLIFDPDDPGEGDPDCTTMIRNSSNGCRASIEERCDWLDENGSYDSGTVMLATVNSGPSGARADGTMDYQIYGRDRRLECSSIGSISYVRQ